ncbi:hypothetical protein D9M69_546220 [compost metagenome]
MNTDHGFQVSAFAFVEALQVRQGLEVVGVQTLLIDLHVRLNVVGEDFDFQVHAFFGEGWLDQLENLGVWNRGRGNHQFLASLGQARGQGSRQCGEQQNLFHAVSLSKITVACGDGLNMRVPVKCYRWREADNTGIFYSRTITFIQVDIPF